nr:helix-turn-helix transcriptional regulator [Vulcaniibacterium tengchongense]
MRGSRSREEFATWLGVHLNTYARYERGEREIGAELLAKLASEGWNGHWLLTGEGPERIDAANDASQAERLDADTLLAAIETVDEALAMPGVPAFTSRGRAELVLAVYRRWIDTPSSPARAVAVVLQTIREAVKSGEFDE